MATLYWDIFYMFHVFISEIAFIIPFHNRKTEFYLK